MCLDDFQIHCESCHNLEGNLDHRSSAVDMSLYQNLDDVGEVDDEGQGEDEDDHVDHFSQAENFDNYVV